MPKSRTISVIIPTLNEEQLLPRAIASVTGADEVIVVDGGSQDPSVSIAEQSGALVVRAERGRGLQLRAGAQQARGDILLLLHADSWLAPGAVDEVRTHAANAEQVFGCFRQQIDDPRFRYRLLERGNAFRATRLRLPYGDQAMFVDRATYDQVGGIDEVPLMEDVLFSRKLRQVMRPIMLNGPLHLSARRWIRRGFVRQTIRNWSIMTAFNLGASPVRLARWYR